MSKVGLLFIVAAALTTAVSNILLRIGVLRTGGLGVSSEGVAADLWRLCQQPFFVLGMALYGVAALTWIRILSTETLATGYVLLVSVAFIAVNLGGYLVFREPLTVQKLVGMGVILAGIVLVAQPS